MIFSGCTLITFNSSYNNKKLIPASLIYKIFDCRDDFWVLKKINVENDEWNTALDIWYRLF